tara:strand:- start:253 stop:429 length:177 start_codon:yes stop_codon:yes gene_type:complete
MFMYASHVWSMASAMLTSSMMTATSKPQRQRSVLVRYFAWYFAAEIYTVIMPQIRKRE